MIPAVIQSSVILSIALCAVTLLRRQSASARHAILTAGLVSSLAVPLLRGVLPEFEFAQSPGLYALVQDQAETLWTWNEGVDPTSPGISASVRTGRNPFLWIWLGGTIVAGVVLAAGATRIAWLISGSRPTAATRCISAAEEIGHLLRLKRRFCLLQNDRAVLGTLGVVRPRIFLPFEAEQWSEERIRVVLTHELAHVKRFDWLVQVFAELVRAVYWFNPLVWLTCRRLRAESEIACDDVVLNNGFDPKDYAAHLLDLARTLKNSNQAWSPVLAMSRSPNLERRFVAMLNSSLNHGSVSRAALFVICTVAIFVTLPLAATRASAELRQPVTAPVLLPTAIAPVEKPPLTGAVPVAARRSSAPRPTSPPAPQGLADGRLYGTVSDSTGAVVPGVTLTVATMERIPNGIRETAVMTSMTDEAGVFEFPALPEGQYSLKADLPGFTSVRKTWIEIKPSQSIRENIILFVGNIVQRVEVNAVGQPKPRVPPGTRQRIRVGGYVIAANLIKQVKPVYPQSARDAGIEGTVHLQGIIGTEGNFITLRVTSNNNSELANAALEAVKQWRYKPALLNNEPIEILTEIDVDFKLSQ